MRQYNRIGLTTVADPGWLGQLATAPCHVAIERMWIMKRWSVAPSLALVVLLSACNYLPALPANPFAVTPTVIAEATAAPVAASPTPFPTPTPAPFTAYWVKNFRTTEMWSGQAGQPGVISFGTTSAQFCSFQPLGQMLTRLCQLVPLV